MLQRWLLAIIILIYVPALFAQQNGAEILNFTTSVTVKNSKLTTSYSYRILILNRSGEELTKVAIPFSKMLKLSDLQACIKGVNGEIFRKLKSSECITRSAISDFSFYEDDFVKEFTLKHNYYPYILEYSFTHTEDQFFVISYWSPVVNHNYPTREANLNVQFPLNYPINLKYDPSVYLKTDTLGDKIELKFEGSYKTVVTQEYFAPDISVVFPSVKIVPEKFTYEISGSQSSWKDFGNWQYNICKNLNDLPLAERATIDQLTAGINDTLAKIKVLYHYLQDRTRYINISIETGGIKPYPASYVSANKYGDCKALANYFKSIMDYVGIPTNYVLIYSDDNRNNIDTCFTATQFNHAITVIPLKNDTLWLDCTSSLAFGYCGIASQNRPALVISENQSHFWTVPAFNPNQNSRCRTFTVESVNSSMANVQVINSYTGNMYEYLNSINQKASASKKEQILHDDFTQPGFTNFSQLKLHPFHRDSLRIYLSYKANSSKLYRYYGNDIITDIVPFPLPVIEKPENRKLPIQINCPVHFLDTIIYLHPENKPVKSKFSDKTSVSKYGMFSIKSQTNHDGTKVIKEFILYGGRYPLSEYPEFYKFINSVRTTEANSHIIF